jgi:ABC-type transporter Mla subunit MlaD
MSEMDQIADRLRRQRKDLEELIESASSQTETTSAIVERIEVLRRRTEETQRLFAASQPFAGPPGAKQDGTAK